MAFLEQLADGAAMCPQIAESQGRKDATLVHAYYRDAVRNFLTPPNRPKVFR